MTSSPTFRCVALAVCLLACAATADAAFVVALDAGGNGSNPAGGPPPSDHVFFHDSEDGSELIGTIGHSPNLQVKFYDAGAEIHPQGNGHAWLTPTGDGAFDGMKIAAHGDTLGFTAIQFNIHADGSGPMTLSAFGSAPRGSARNGGGGGGASVVLADEVTLDLRGNGQNRLTVFSDEPFTELQIDSSVGIESIRQVRVTAEVVPEPGTLALACASVAGLLLRRRR